MVTPTEALLETVKLIEVQLLEQVRIEAVAPEVMAILIAIHEVAATAEVRPLEQVLTDLPEVAVEAIVLAEAVPEVLPAHLAVLQDLVHQAEAEANPKIDLKPI